ncbi:hypothetical protein J4727_13840 [Providencia rettgeri]|uniref:Uncharacterized protein n=1 Tax=Providencia rettgeri TaxID=587 RepID=A0A939NFT9_PRORE|nr:hypothetical protein [Providencia rettgeri]
MILNRRYLISSAKAVNYLIESVNINPDNNMALFEMSKLYHKGVVLNENENKANLILDKIIKKEGEILY